MDALVLDAHDDGPPRVVPVHRQLQRRLADDAVDHGTDAVTVGAHLGGGRPVVVRLVEVIPAHLVDAHREHRLEARVDALGDEPGQQQFVGEEGRRVSVVEDQRVAQADRLDAVAVLVYQRLEQRLVGAEGGVKVIGERPPKSLRVAAAEIGRPRKEES